MTYNVFGGTLNPTLLYYYSVECSVLLLTRDRALDRVHNSRLVSLCDCVTITFDLFLILLVSVDGL